MFFDQQGTQGGRTLFHRGDSWGHGFCFRHDSAGSGHRKVVEGGIEAQARQALENVKTVLGEMNLTMQDALKVSVFLTDLADFGTVNAIYGEYFGPNFPARTCMQVGALPMGVSIEIEVIASK